MRGWVTPGGAWSPVLDLDARRAEVVAELADQRIDVGDGDPRDLPERTLRAEVGRAERLAIA